MNDDRLRQVRMRQGKIPKQAEEERPATWCSEIQNLNHFVRKFKGNHINKSNKYVQNLGDNLNKHHFKAVLRSRDILN